MAVICKPFSISTIKCKSYLFKFDIISCFCPSATGET